jgi:hypothetical protein
MPICFHALRAASAIRIILGSPCPALSLSTTHTGVLLALCSPTCFVWTKAPGAPQTSLTPTARTGAFPHTIGRTWRKRATAGELQHSKASCSVLLLHSSRTPCVDGQQHPEHGCVCVVPCLIVATNMRSVTLASSALGSPAGTWFLSPTPTLHYIVTVTVISIGNTLCHACRETGTTYM